MMTNEQIDAVARRVVEMLRAERELKRRAAFLDVLARAEGGLDALDSALIRMRRGVELGEF